MGYFKVATVTHNGLRVSAVDMVHEGLDVSRGVVHVGDWRIRIQATRVHLIAILEIEGRDSKNGLVNGLTGQFRQHIFVYLENVDWI